jgi:hypothetical protein
LVIPSNTCAKISARSLADFAAAFAMPHCSR